MDLWQLKIFCRVVDLSSFSKAAELINLSQPTVSSHIKALEQHFGCRLVDRYPKTVVPTGAGRLLYRYACDIIKMAEETETALADFQGEIKGRLAVGGSTIPAGYLLPGVIGGFLGQYPEVILSLAVGDTEKMVDQTISGALDLSVVGARMDRHHIQQTVLTDDQMRLILPAGHRWSERRSITLSELAGEPFIVREPGSGTLKSIERRFKSAGASIQNLHVVAELGSTEAVRQAIKSGIGLSILSTAAVSEELRLGSMTALDIQGVNLKRNFYLTVRKGRTLSPAAKTLSAFLKAHFRDKAPSSTE